MAENKKTEVLDERTIWRSVWFPGPYIAGMTLMSVLAVHGVSSVIRGETFQPFDTGIFDLKVDNFNEMLAVAEIPLGLAVFAGIIYLGIKRQWDTVHRRTLVQPPKVQPPNIIEQGRVTQ